MAWPSSWCRRRLRARSLALQLAPQSAASTGTSCCITACEGVGSNATQPYVGKYTSGHACADDSRIVYSPVCGSYVPGAYPPASRVGTPRSRSMTTMAPA